MADSNYINYENGTTSGTGGNKVTWSQGTNSVVNNIDNENDPGSAAIEWTNDSTVHNPSASNVAAYTGHGIVHQGSAQKGKIGNCIAYDIAAYGANNQGLCVSDTGSGKNLVTVYEDSNVMFATNGADIAKLDATGDLGANLCFGPHGGDYGAGIAQWKTALQSTNVGAKVLNLARTAHQAAANDIQADPLYTSVSGLNLQPMIGLPASGRSNVVNLISGTANVLDLNGNRVTDGNGNLCSIPPAGAYLIQAVAPMGMGF